MMVRQEFFGGVEVMGDSFELVYVFNDLRLVLALSYLHLTQCAPG
jgi:hypothetical protein